jgi:hypothetical protein
MDVELSEVRIDEEFEKAWKTGTDALAVAYLIKYGKPAVTKTTVRVLPSGVLELSCEIPNIAGTSMKVPADFWTWADPKKRN